VRAALEIQQHLQALRLDRPRLSMQVRIGITTGPVLLRFDRGIGVDGVGDVVNTAARLESAAPLDACWWASVLAFAAQPPLWLTTSTLCLSGSSTNAP
jgi:class 3 adenylate cyclase